MRILIYLCLVLLNDAICNGSEDSQHIHFRIHVPKLINHQIHTKTVYIHLPKVAPKKKEAPKKKKKGPKVYHKEHHRENWGTWSTYHQSDFEDNDNNVLRANKDHDDHNSREISPTYDRKKPQKIPQKYHPLYNHQRNSYLPQNSQDSEENHLNYGYGQDGMVGYSYPPQYSVHENVNEANPNHVDTVSYNYEKGYKKGLETETGHVYADQSTKFHDAQHEEYEGSNEDYANEVEGKTHSGRYLVDDTEYNNKSEENDITRKKYVT